MSQAIIPVIRIIAIVGGQEVELSPDEFNALYSAGLLSFGNGSARPTPTRTAPARINRNGVAARKLRAKRAATRATPIKTTRAAKKVTKRGSTVPAGYWKAAKAWGSANGFTINDRGAPSKAVLADYYKSPERKKAFPTFTPS